MATRSNDVQSELAELKDDFAKLRGDLGDLTKAIIDAGKQTGAAAAEQLHDKVEDVKQRGREKFDKVEHQIEDNPWTSVGVALSVGLIVGFLLRR